MSISPRGQRTATRLGAVGAGIAAVAALALTVVPSTAEAATHRAAASPTVVATGVYGTQTKVVTSKGHKVSVTVGGSTGSGEFRVPARFRSLHVPAPRSTSQSSSLYVSIYNSSQSHAWVFNLPTSSLTVKSSGKGTLKVPSTKISPFGKVSLTMTPKGSPTIQKCQGVATSKTQKVKLAGTFFFDTRSGKHGWGTVGSKTKTFTFSTSAAVDWTYSYDGNCSPAYTPPCVNYVSWDAFDNGGSGYLSGEAKPTKSVSASRNVTFTKPAGANRYDYASASLKSATLTTGSGSATLKLTGNGSASTGAATIHAGDQYTESPTACGTDGQTSTTTEWNGTLTNGSKALQVHDIFGGMGVKSGSSASINRATVHSAS